MRLKSLIMPALIIGKHKARTIKKAYKSFDISVGILNTNVANVKIVKYKMEPKLIEISEFLNDLLPK